VELYSNIIGEMCSTSEQYKFIGHKTHGKSMSKEKDKKVNKERN
jgi:hypothetical protein